MIHLNLQQIVCSLISLCVFFEIQRLRGQVKSISSSHHFFLRAKKIWFTILKIQNKKTRKKISKFYRRQNELLENYKTDNEQIQKSRQSKTSESKAEKQYGTTRAPLLKNVVSYDFLTIEQIFRMMR